MALRSITASTPSAKRPDEEEGTELPSLTATPELEAVRVAGPVKEGPETSASFEPASPVAGPESPPPEGPPEGGQAAEGAGPGEEASAAAGSEEATGMQPL